MTGPGGPGGNGMSTYQLVLEVRQKVDGILQALVGKVDREDVRRLEDRLEGRYKDLEDKVNEIDLDGSHGMKELKLITSENSGRIDSLIGWRNRLAGAYLAAVIFIPLLSAVAIHWLWS